jgi:DNA-binding GntR family transcriptional regulator
MAKTKISINRGERLVFQVYNQILGIIHDGGVARTEKISALNLSEKLGVSRTPVSFALFRMELEGLLSGDEKGGWTVIPITLAELDECFDLKECLFPVIVESAALKTTADNIEKLYLFIDEISRSIKWNDLSSWRAADKGFNHLLEIISGNHRLGYVEQVIDNQLYRILSTYLAFPNSDKDIFSSYQDIVFAIGSGNSMQAKEKAIEFVSGLRINLKRFLQDVVIPLLGPNNLNQ